MHFLPDVWVECETCHGKRYNRETLGVTYRGHSIADVLEMPIGQAYELFENIPRIRRLSGDAVRDRSRLSHAGPARADAFGGRSPTRETGRRAGTARHGPNALHPR